MPSQDDRPRNEPDTREQYERAVPKKEPGLGEMKPTDNTPVEQADEEMEGREQSERHRERTADDIMDKTDAVDPTSEGAHGNRAGADEAEAIGKDKHEHVSDTERH